MLPTTWFERLEEMNGRIGLTRELEAECLALYAQMPGDYVEVGCLWGGSALIAALAKEDSDEPGAVYTIDRMHGGWWDDKDPAVGNPPTPWAVLDNFARFGVAYRIHPICAESYPWPLPTWITPSVAFIDGDHSYEGCKRDYLSLREITTNYLLFHDYAASHPGVRKAVQEVIQNDKLWHYVKTVNSIAVFEKEDDGAIFSRLRQLQSVERV